MQGSQVEAYATSTMGKRTGTSMEFWNEELELLVSLTIHHTCPPVRLMQAYFTDSVEGSGIH